MVRVRGRVVDITAEVLSYFRARQISAGGFPQRIRPNLRILNQRDVVARVFGIVSRHRPRNQNRKSAFEERGGTGDCIMSPIFPSTERDAKRWRRLEAEARVIALTMADLEAKRVMLTIADSYKRLAERAEVRNARHLMDGVSFGPDALKVIGEAFDAAWAEIASNFTGNLIQNDAARLKLATSVLSIASEDSRDVQVLKRAALQRMALDYRRL